MLYQSTEKLFNRLGILISPAEVHGHLCGRHIVGHHIESPFGIRIVEDYLEYPLGDQAEAADVLAQLIEQHTLIMDRDLFEFRLFLPGDDSAISSRVQALSSWVEGLLAGIGSTLGDAEAAVMAAEEHILADLVEISRADTSARESEENETSYAEIAEYVRLAAFNLYDRFREVVEDHPMGEPS